MRKNIVGLSVITVAILCALGCSARIDKNYLGRYNDVTNPRNSIKLFDNGVCPVTANEDIRKFRCSIKDTTVTMQLIDGTDQQRQSFEYPEFRGVSATLTIDGSTLITQTGRRFVYVKDPSQSYGRDE